MVDVESEGWHNTTSCKDFLRYRRQDSKSKLGIFRPALRCANQRQPAFWNTGAIYWLGGFDLLYSQHKAGMALVDYRQVMRQRSDFLESGTNTAYVRAIEREAYK